MPPDDTQKEPLHYEETPLIDPDSVAPQPASIIIDHPTTHAPELPDPLATPELPEHPHPELPLAARSASRRKGSVIGNVFLFVVLFIVGIGLSSILRQMLPNGIPLAPAPTSTPEESAVLPSPVITQITDQQRAWSQAAVLQAGTRAAYPGLLVFLPPGVLPFDCDTPSCSSQGTYLPGGTRLTVAIGGGRGVLRDFERRTITDAAGKKFESAPGVVSGRGGIEFHGTFSGTTTGGYVFSAMHGIMVPISDTEWLEINHFSPSGITSDFEGDDGLFSQIIGVIALPGANVGLDVPLPTAEPTIFP